MRVLGLSFALLFAHPAWADTAVAIPPAPSPASVVACKKALKQGRALESNHDWKGAMAALRECLATDPNHAQASGDDGDDPENKAPAVVTLLEASFDQQGQLVIKNKRGAKKDPSIGVHSLSFP